MYITSVQILNLLLQVIIIVVGVWSTIIIIKNFAGLFTAGFCSLLLITIGVRMIWEVIYRNIDIASQYGK